MSVFRFYLVINIDSILSFAQSSSRSRLIIIIIIHTHTHTVPACSELNINIQVFVRLISNSLQSLNIADNNNYATSVI